MSQLLQVRQLHVTLGPGSSRQNLRTRLAQGTAFGSTGVPVNAWNPLEAAASEQCGGLRRLSQRRLHLVGVTLNYVQLHIKRGDTYELARTWRLVGSLAWERTL